MMEGASCVVDFGAYAGKALVYPLRKTGVGLRVWAELHLHSQQNPFWGAHFLSRSLYFLEKLVNV